MKIAGTGDDATSAERLSGIVTHFNSQRGFGFIHSDTIKENVWFHVSAVENVDHGIPTQGDSVLFESQPGEKGIAASSVKILWKYGIVSTFRLDGGFGFIESADYKDDIFFHKFELRDADKFRGE